MKSIDEELLNESKKEVFLYSKELENIVNPEREKNLAEDLYFEAVFKNKIITLEYIKIKINKNRVKIKALCAAQDVSELINYTPEFFVLKYKENIIKKIKLHFESNISLSIYKENHKYIVSYTIII